MTTATQSASEALHELRERQAAAEARVQEIVHEQYATSAAVKRAGDELAAFERTGGDLAERAKLERKLTQAKMKAGEPWRERVRGAEAAVRDARADVARLVAERFDELLGELEQKGVAVAERLDDAARNVVEAHAEREVVAHEIAQLVSTISRVRPGDVSYSRADALSREAKRLVHLGEEPPRLRRDLREARMGRRMAASL